MAPTELSKNDICGRFTAILTPTLSMLPESGRPLSTNE